MSVSKFLALAVGLSLAAISPVGAHVAPKKEATTPQVKQAAPDQPVAETEATAAKPKGAESKDADNHGDSDHAGHGDEVHLDAEQIAAGNFSIEAARMDSIGARITVPGTMVPSGDHIARVAVRLVGTVVELRKRLGDTVTAGEVVAVIESREVADAKSDYLAAQLMFGLQETLFSRAKRLFDGAVMTENDYPARAHHLRGQPHQARSGAAEAVRAQPDRRADRSPATTAARAVAPAGTARADRRQGC